MKISTKKILAFLTLVFVFSEVCFISEALSKDKKDKKMEEAEAQHKLAVKYYNGDGVKQDYKKAAKWFREAAEQDYPDAQYNLSYMYFNGEGVLEKSTDEAVKWLRKAAQNGETRSQEILKQLEISW